MKAIDARSRLQNSSWKYPLYCVSSRSAKRICRFAPRMCQYWRCSWGTCSPRAACVSSSPEGPPTVRVRQAEERVREWDGARGRERKKEKIKKQRERKREKCRETFLHVTRIAGALLKCRTNRRSPQRYGERTRDVTRLHGRVHAKWFLWEYEISRPHCVTSIRHSIVRNAAGWIADDSKSFHQQNFYRKRVNNQLWFMTQRVLHFLLRTSPIIQPFL